MSVSLSVKMTPLFVLCLWGNTSDDVRILITDPADEEVIEIVSSNVEHPDSR